MPRRRGVYVAFKTARTFARSLRLKSTRSWEQWAKANREELSKRQIPARPDTVYANAGWADWLDWLGANPAVLKPVMPYEKWRAWLRTKNFRRRQDYDDWCSAQKSGSWDRQDRGMSERERLGIPSDPRRAYREFKGWSVELKGTPPAKRNAPRAYVSFGEARRYVRQLLKSPDWDASRYPRTAKGWKAYARDHRHTIPLRIPVAVDTVAQYQADFRGWRDFLGTNTFPTPNRKR